MSGQAPLVRPYGEAAIAEAAALVRAGQPVGIATETVYGLAADATRADAVAAIYAAKGRPDFNPLIVHIADRAAADRLANFSAMAAILADRFWPGPLTLVLPLRPGAGIAPAVTAGLATIALRCPAHPAMRALLKAVDRPLAAPSANRSGAISPTDAGHVAASLAGRIPLVVDSGATAVGLESTIVAIEGQDWRLLRPGPIPADSLATILRRPPLATPDRIAAPGMLASHYAPDRPVRLNARDAGPGEWLIGFGPVRGDSTLSATGDLHEAAAGLYARLHEADRAGRAGIAVAPIPGKGVGTAINDRLRRAAAPR